jgi:hypothetical protein
LQRKPLFRSPMSGRRPVTASVCILSSWPWSSWRVLARCCSFQC